MKNKIRSIMADAGIPEVGFCDFSWVAEHLLACRAKARLPENAQTIVLCVFPYKVKEQRPENISRYAAVPDYHAVCGAFLDRAVEGLRDAFPEARFERFLDNSPIPEVYAASCAGLGRRGENGLLIHPKYGSFVFIGEIVTDLSIPCENRFAACPGCGACQSACPVGLCHDRCLSAVSQQKKELSAEQADLLSENGIVWGCDLCAESCPLNRNAALTDIPDFLTGYRDAYTAGEDITGRAYEWRGKRVVERNFENGKRGK